MARRLHDVLERGHVREQVEGLEHHADLGADLGDSLRWLRPRHAVDEVAEGGLAVDADQAPLGHLEPVEAAQEGGLAASRTGR